MQKGKQTKALLPQTMDKPTIQTNNPAKAGAGRSAKVVFGDFNRFCCFCVHTRDIPGMPAESWFVTDAETFCKDTGLASVVAQKGTFESAMAAVGF